MSETVEGFCRDAEKAYSENQYQKAIDYLEAAIGLIYDDWEAQLET